MTGQFVGPHTADLQQRADNLAVLCAEKRIMPAHVAATLVADDVLTGRDP